MPSTYYLNFEAMLGIYLRRNEMVTLFRWMVGFDKELIPARLKNSGDGPNLDATVANLIIKTTVWTNIAFNFVVALIYIVKPTAPQYFYSSWTEVDKPRWMNTAVYLFSLVFEFYTKTVDISSYFLLQMWFPLSVAYLLFSMSTVRKSTRSLPDRFAWYRCLYLINLLHNKCYPGTMLPAKYVFMGGTIIGVGFMMLRFYAEISFPEQMMTLLMFCTFSSTAFFYLHISGKVFKNSGNLREKLSSLAGVGVWSTRERKLLKREAKSLQSFGVRVGSIRATSYIALNAFFSTVTSGFTTVLVTFPVDGADGV
ncbi:hypothetical protein Fcan01_20973 [Folsomia candida]|uniref:Uncharacterized protein n=1 Tax=Folsomia candida TaxID=158441 RepID=A0A226DG91_FOLCA|nr:hypothetical protein Fcan01_20973 [Folsomia candida]